MVFKLQSGHIINYYRNHYFQCSKAQNSKSRLSRVRVLVFCTSSYDVLYLCEVLSKYLKQFPTELMQIHGRNGYFQYLLCSKGGLKCLFVLRFYGPVNPMEGWSKSRLTRATVLIFCTTPHGALHL